MTFIYIAGPLFNTHERWYLERIAAALEAAGYRTFLPQRDAGLLDSRTPADQSRLFRADLAALDACDGCVALLTGADHDSGTSAELGYMYAQGKPCVGLTDDMRTMNNMIWGICGEGQQLARTIEEMLGLVAAWGVASPSESGE
ncbi:MAG: nucleoside 2-deoxyribosyltransferase [Chloroflexaceae bacterium]